LIVVSPVTGTLTSEVPVAAGVATTAGVAFVADDVLVGPARAVAAGTTVDTISVASGWTWVGTPVTTAGPQAVIKRASKTIAPNNEVYFMYSLLSLKSFTNML
jgi:hypothetical protein